MSYERLIAEHARIDVHTERLLALVDAGVPDIARVIVRLADLSSELGDHLAHEDSFIYPRMIAAKDTEMSEAAEGFVRDFASLRADWVLYITEWTSETIAGDWDTFRAETREILMRLAARVIAENELLYPAALQNGVIPLRCPQKPRAIAA